MTGFLPLLPCRKNFLPLFIYPCNIRFICLLVHPSTIAALFLLAVSGWSANPFITSYFFCSFIDKTTFLISLFLLFNKMYKALFYHKQDILVWGILGLYHIRRYCTRVVYFYCEKCRKLFSDLIMSDSVSRVFVGNSANRIFFIQVTNRLYLYLSYTK